MARAGEARRLREKSRRKKNPDATEGRVMKKVFEIGGVVASVVLIAFWMVQARRQKPDEPDGQPGEDSTPVESATA